MKKLVILGLLALGCGEGQADDYTCVAMLGPDATTKQIEYCAENPTSQPPAAEPGDLPWLEFDVVTDVVMEIIPPDADHKHDPIVLIHPCGAETHLDDYLRKLHKQFHEEMGEADAAARNANCPPFCS